MVYKAVAILDNGIDFGNETVYGIYLTDKGGDNVSEYFSYLFLMSAFLKKGGVIIEKDGRKQIQYGKITASYDDALCVFLGVLLSEVIDFKIIDIDPVETNHPEIKDRGNIDKYIELAIIADDNEHV